MHRSDFLVDHIDKLPAPAAFIDISSNAEKQEIVECYTRMRDAHLQEAKRLSHCLEEFEKKWSVAEEDAAHPKKRRREKKGRRRRSTRRKRSTRKKKTEMKEAKTEINETEMKEKEAETEMKRGMRR